MRHAGGVRRGTLVLYGAKLYVMIRTTVRPFETDNATKYSTTHVVAVLLDFSKSSSLDVTG
jgi:hypothetical protein